MCTMATNDSRIGSSATPPSNGDDCETHILVRISPVIEREFKRRDVFPELMADRAVRIINGATGEHRVSMTKAREIIANANAQLANRYDLARGLPMAYSCLVRNIEETIRQEERRGLFADPGMEEVRQRMTESPARLSVGERVLCFDDRSEYGFDVEVVKGYNFYSVASAQGSFVQDNGKRLDYQFGYVVKRGDEQFFVAPHQLTREDCKPSHLRLVTRGAVQTTRADRGMVQR
jgi:hypothetical protein